MTKTKILGVILAGGESSRMGEQKALVKLGGKTLIRHVYERFSPQVDEMVVSGTSDFGLGLETVADVLPDLVGPIAGLYATALWARENCPNMEALVTVPVDAPFLPGDLVKKLLPHPPCIATAGRRHPTFANWGREADVLLKSFLKESPKTSIIALSEFAKAREISFPNENNFININTPEDLERARNFLS